jgi:phosphoenolpyruvate carboxylase
MLLLPAFLPKKEKGARRRSDLMDTWVTTPTLAQEHLLEAWLDQSRADDHARRVRAASTVDLRSIVAGAKTPENLAAELAQIRIVPVLTAHPSEMRPPKVLRALAESDDTASALANLQATGSRVRLERPTIADEVDALLAHFEHVLFEAIPDFYEALEAAAFARFGAQAPPIPILFTFHSWVGSDRDGNPACTAATTLAAAERMHRCIIERYRADLRLLTHLCEGSGTAHFRRLHDGLSIVDGIATIASEVFAAELATVERYDFPEPARRAFARLRRRHESFGFHLATLEWRQHSDYLLYTFDEREHALHPERRHFAELDAHFQAARIRDSFRDGKSLLDYEHLLVTPKAKEVVASLRVLGEIRKRYGGAAVGEIIISNCEESAVVLVLERLALDAGVYACGEIQIVPILESLSALQRGPHMLHTLLAEPLIRKKIARLDNRIEIMLGYSDAAKDGGRIAADLGIAKARQNLVDACLMHGVAPRFFHGRGGSPGRGFATFAEAAQSIDRRLPPGELKLTEQGEVVANRYGHPRLAAHTLRSWFHEVVLNIRRKDGPTHITVENELTALEARIANAGATAFRALREKNTFMESVRALAPLDLIRECPLSSRPASRGTSFASATDLATLRAVPFNMAFNAVFAQIPAWYGTGTALEEEMQRSGVSLLQYAYQHRPAFRFSLKHTQAALEATNLSVMRRRSTETNQTEFFAQIEQEEERTRSIIGEITGTTPPTFPSATPDSPLAHLAHLLSTSNPCTAPYSEYLALATITAALGMTG